MTDDGSGLDFLIPGDTAKGAPKSWATPLSPSITDEVSSNDNNAIPSTSNDELYAWLLQKKVDDPSIGKYLCAREITLSELEEFDDAELELLIKDIEKANENTLQMIDKSRFLRACRSLRKQRANNQTLSLSTGTGQQSVSISQSPSPSLNQYHRGL